MTKRKDKDDDENPTEEMIAEDWCFVCKDGGELLLCDHRSSKYHCYCCPNAVCRGCTGEARFVRVNKKYGFCHDCTKLALLVEENKDVDSEGKKYCLGHNRLAKAMLYGEE
nr:zinc finger CCCH domain-containing protein 19-like isoform X1 [Ipomoea batatas]